ncbi:unnamed protein product [Protopolystoma xenopodis]|uniref:Uncharacterized protein n=1 Tax=Protopolystoma xenopodis TaxID=117903 RepID=A0A448XMQ2_9PLAT|nr:unnamed protein product [Protopolystoma xenopodis]
MAIEYNAADSLISVRHVHRIFTRGGFDDWDIVTTTEVHSHQPRAGKPIATSPPASSLSSSSTASNGFRGAGAPFAQSSVHAPPRLTSSSSLFSSLSQQFERTFSTVQKAIDKLITKPIFA